MANEIELEFSRRDVLRAGVSLIPLVVAVATPVALAQQKVSKEQAQYQESPKDGQTCSMCLHFTSPDACRLVDGKISASGWCSLYAPKPG
jgi:hypothetical protein